MTASVATDVVAIAAMGREMAEIMVELAPASDERQQAIDHVNAAVQWARTVLDQGGE